VLSQFGQKLGDLLDGFEVHVGLQLSQGGDDWLQQGFVGGVLLHFDENGVVLGFQLGE
jgi:hypothetical protein